MGADRALKRLALQRVRDVDLWRAPLVRAGEPVAEARARVESSEVPYALLVDDDDGPLGWLTERGLAGDRVGDTPSSSPEPVVELDDVLRDALERPARARGPVRPSRRPPGPRGRRAVDRAALARDRRDAGGRVTERLRPAPAPRPQRRGLRVGQRDLPGLDRRQHRPLRRAVLAARVPHAGVGCDRLRDRVRAGAARAPAPLAGPADHPDHRDPLHAAERRGVLPAAAADRSRRHDGDHRARRRTRC